MSRKEKKPPPAPNALETTRLAIAASVRNACGVSLVAVRQISSDPPCSLDAVECNDEWHELSCIL